MTNNIRACIFTIPVSAAVDLQIGDVPCKNGLPVKVYGDECLSVKPQPPMPLA